jgi:hypothetical protein
MTETILLAIVLIFIAIQTGINIWAIKKITDNERWLQIVLEIIDKYRKEQEWTSKTKL